MSRFLTISHIEGGPTLVHGPQRSPGDAPLVAEFRDGMDAMRFLTAVANAENNPEARADYLERRELCVVEMSDGSCWISELPDIETAVAAFAERADADLFVNFMRQGT